MTRIGLELAALDALDDVGQYRIGAAAECELGALAHDIAIEEFDFRAPALEHVLAHRGALLERGMLAILEALLLVAAHCRFIALSGPRNDFRRQVQDLLQLVALCLADPDCLTAKPRRKAADRLVVQHLRAGKAGTG